MCMFARGHTQERLVAEGLILMPKTLQSLHTYTDMAVEPMEIEMAVVLGTFAARSPVSRYHSVGHFIKPPVES